MGLLDYFDEDSPLFGGLFGGAQSPPPVPPTNVPGGDGNALSVPVLAASAAGTDVSGPPLSILPPGLQAKEQTSPALPQWLQTAQDQYQAMAPAAGLTQAQFNDRFNAAAVNV